MSWLRSHQWWLEEPGPKPGPVLQGLTWCSLAGKAVTTLGRTRPLTNDSPPGLSPVVKWAPLESHPLWVTKLGCCTLAGVNSFTISPPEITAPRMWAPSRKEKKVQTGPSAMWKGETCKVGPPGRLNSLGHGDSDRRTRTCKGMVRVPSGYVWILSSANRVRGQRQAWLLWLCLSTCNPKWTRERTKAILYKVITNSASLP